MYLTHAEYEVEKILAERKRGGDLEYKVLWKGYGMETWEPVHNLCCPHLLKEYKVESTIIVAS